MKQGATAAQELRRLLDPAALDCPDYVRHVRTYGRHPTSVLEGGTGRTLLLLHGGIASGAASWYPVLPGLARDWHVIAPDMPGCGASDPFPRGGTCAAYRDWFEAVVDATAPAAVVAASIGGALALHAWAGGACRRPPLVLVGAPGLTRFRPPAVALAAMLTFTLAPSRFTLWTLARCTHARIVDTPVTRRFAAGTLAAMRRPGGRRFLRDLGPCTRVATPEVPSGTANMTGIWGERDPFVPAHALPGWLHCRIVAGAGHYPFMDAPGPFLAALGDTLAGLPG